MKRVVLAALLALLPVAAVAEDEGSGMRYQRCLDEKLDPQRRVENCQQLIKDHGTFVGYAFLGLGEAYAAMGDNDKALTAYAELENFRYWTAPKVKRSELYAAMGDYDKALADANAVIDMRGGRAIGLHSRCWARAIAGKELEAGLADCDETADSGAPRSVAFCGVCGTALYSTAPQDRSVFNLRLGWIRQRAELAPQRQGFCGSALSWAFDIRDVERVPEQR